MKRKCLNISIIFPFLALSIFFFLLNLHPANPPNPTPDPPPHPTRRTHNFTLLIGILTRPEYFDRRHFLRLIYSVQTPSPAAKITVKFVLCRLKTPEHRAFVGLEILRHADILFLRCAENMNSGKTHAYFSSLPKTLAHKYDYVMKADDDVLIRLAPLASSLGPLPRRDLYYGAGVPCGGGRKADVAYMSGMGYVLSWDLVEWISESDIPRSEIVGPEDKLVGKWLKMAGKGKNRFSDKPAMYDFPGTNGKCSHELVPETVAVHRLKRWDQWLRVIEYFNVTEELELSGVYNI